ncbi:T9SS type A sorting domain-containing protein [Taibaiella chishuiensis]|uniref:Putative secreted protein (Por secretion system target) n=1 Tax=Taibaiella chishuiensis TaxID=1434707 RepID=A0A2P8CWG3_9BACT|nr:T9SS type A sorting domain-containing protein [Taibaiella chishuiensis]PSK89318.1 putative secreted protein (Por secretion system target) [Taibaiella chishuiensis]
MKKNYLNLLRSAQLTALLCLALSIPALAQAPANDECSGAISITPSATATCSTPTSGNSGTATLSSDPISNCAYEPSHDLWYSFQATGAAHQISLTNVTPTASNLAYYAYTLSVYSGACGTLTEFNCGDGYQDISAGDPATDIVFTASGLTAGATYYIRVAGDDASDDNFNTVATGISFDLCVGAAPPAPVYDECAGATFINSSGTTTVSNINATQSMAPITCEGYTAFVANDIWFKFVPATTGNMTVDVDQTDIDAVWELFSGTCGSLTSMGCSDEGGPISAAVTAGQTYYLRAYAYSSNTSGDFIITVGGVPLPVQFVTLTGAVKDNYARLSWTTSSEHNNKGFIVQRSDDGRQFSTIGYLATQAPNGNSEHKLSYTFDDRSPVYNSVFYRLEQEDMDGRKQQSKILRLDAADAAFDMIAAPNPFTGSVSVNTYGATGSDAVIRIMSLAGNVVRTLPVTAAETLIDLSSLATGTYLVQYTDSRQSKTIKLSKQ